MRALGTFFLLAMLGSQTVLAQAQPSVIVSPMRGAQSKSAVAAIADKMNQSGRVLVVAPEKVQGFIDQYSQTKKPTSSKEAFEFFERGKRAYQNLDMENAVDSFRKAERLYKSTLWDQDSFASFRTTKFQLAQSFLALGRVEEARVQMQEVLLLDPNRAEKKLSEKYYSPQVRQMHEQLLLEFERGEVGDVAVQVEPAGTQVFFDGELVGESPTSLKKVPVGKHYFRFVKGGYEEKISEQFVVVGQNRVVLQLQSLQNQDVKRFFDTVASITEVAPARMKFLDEIGLSMGGDIFLFLTPLSGKVRGQLFDQRSQELSPAIEAQNPDQLVTAVLGFVGQDGYVTRASTPPVSPEKTVKPKPRSGQKQQQDIQYTPAKKSKLVRTPLTKRWWFWPVIGVVAAGAGAGLYFGGVFDQSTSSRTLVTEIP